jgi:hypothetical protein
MKILILYETGGLQQSPDYCLPQRTKLRKLAARQPDSHIELRVRAASIYLLGYSTEPISDA